MVSVKVFVGGDSTPYDAAAQAEREANAFLLNHHIDWGQVKAHHTNAYLGSKSDEGDWHYFILTLVIEMPEEAAVETMW